MKIKSFFLCLAYSSLMVHLAMAGFPDGYVASESFRLATRTVGRAANSVVWLSPVAENEVPAPQLTVDGAPAVGWSKTNPWWDSTQVADGWHTFVLTERNKTFEAKLLVLNRPAIHAGTLEVDEMWTADRVHLVEGAVTLPAGVTLTIDDGAVVKFFANSSLTVAEGGKLVLRGGTAGSPPIRYNFIHNATPWWEQSEVTHSGNSAWRSGAIGNGGCTSMKLHFQGAGTISFWWRTSSESGCDILHFYLDGNEKARLSGERSWEQKSWEVSGDGEHSERQQHGRADDNGG